MKLRGVTNKVRMMQLDFSAGDRSVEDIVMLVEYFGLKECALLSQLSGR